MIGQTGLLFAGGERVRRGLAGCAALACLAVAPVASAQVGTCDGVRVKLVCCQTVPGASTGQYRFRLICVHLSAWTRFWNECGGIQALPSCPPGQFAYALALNVSCVGCYLNEAAWVRPVNLSSPTQPNCHFNCIEPCWNVEECYLWQCDPWGVPCEDWL